jgi:putative oxidoreductase
MEIIVLVARILFAYLLIGSGFGHLTQTSAMAGYAQSRGLPSPKLAVQVSGLGFLLGGLAILFGIWGDLAALLIAVLLLIIAVMMHAFWKEADATSKMTEMVQFNKDVALAAGALAFLALFNHGGLDDAFTVTDSLLKIDW